MESGPYVFQCVPLRAQRIVHPPKRSPRTPALSSVLVEKGVVYLALAERSYPKKLAFQVREGGGRNAAGCLPLERSRGVLCAVLV